MSTRPTVLEVTEACERELRHILRRGQIWNVWMDQPNTAKKNPSVQAKLAEEVDATNLPQPFDVRPVVENLYHVVGMLLNVKNPLPDLVFMEDIEGPIPQALDTKDDSPPMADPNFSFLEDMAKRKKAPVDKARGAYTDAERRKHVQ